MLGEIQLVLGGAWTATIEAESPCLLYRLPRAVLDALSDREGEIVEPLVWIVRSRLGRTQLAEVLRASSAHSTPKNSRTPLMPRR